MTVVDVLTALASSPWAYLVLAGILIIDGFFPFVPGETAVVTLSTLGAAGHGPLWWVVLAVAIAATMVGDGIAFAVGRRIGLTRWRWMRRPRVQASIAWAMRGLHKRPAVFFSTAKFVPFARVAVTMSAGAERRLPIARYLVLSLIAATIYTSYHVLLGMVAGTALASNPLLATVIAIAAMLLIGFIVERIRAFRARRLNG